MRSGVSHRRETFIDPNIIILFVKLTFVLLICGSSYLAGSLWGRHSLEPNLAPLGVEQLFRDGDKNDAECEEARRKWIEQRVQEGKLRVHTICCLQILLELNQ